MRRPQKPNGRTQTSFIRSVSSPVGGWNARDPLARQKPTDAIKLDNFFCTPYDVGVRLGYANQMTAFNNQVNTLAAFAPVSGTSKLFSFSGTKIYDSTSSGAIGTPVIDGNVSSTFQTTGFGTAAGNALVAVSGSDLPLTYNGTVWSNSFSAAFTSTLASLSSVGTTATITWTTPHNLKTGMSITVAGVTPAGYNGTYVITVTSTTAATFTLPGALGVVTVLGTATPTVNAAITGVNPSTFIHVVAHKNRLFFVQKDSTKAWYLPVLSLGGAAAAIDLSSLFTQGGYLVAAATWTLDAGYGLDDYIVFMSSNGQAAVYQGTDPASASTWGLIGVFDLGAPIGRRCFAKYAGDLLFICKDGLVSLSKALQSTRISNTDSLTDKIQQAISAYTTMYSSFFGWEIVSFPKQNMLLLNIPTSASTAIQVAMNTISGAWSSFSGWNAFTFTIFNDDLYFGANTYVAHAWSTYADNGTNINLNAQQSFNYFGTEAQLKHVKMARPVISTDGAPALLFDVNVDFDTTDPTGVPSFSPVLAGTWDNGLWDTAVWGGDPVIQKDWQTVFGLGYCVSGHLKGTVNGVQLRWAATDYMMENGGMI